VTTDHPIHQRSRALLLLSVVLIYYAVVDVFVTHLAFSLSGIAWFGVVYQGLRLLLLLAGLQILSRFWKRQTDSFGSDVVPQASPLGWKWLARTRSDVGTGALLGWGIAVALVLPITLDGGLQVYFDASLGSWGRLLLIILATACGAALRQTVLSGFPFRRLADATRPVTAVLLMSLFAVMSQFRDMRGNWAALAAVFLFQVLCCVASLRTGSLWLGWAADFAGRFALGAVFGFAVLGNSQYSSNVLSGSDAPDWITGGMLGPVGSWLAPAVMLIAIAVLLQVTEIDVIANIRPAGIPMNVAEIHAPAFPAVATAQPAGTSLIQIAPPPPAPEIPPAPEREP
jgi:hypothetical protein